MAYEGLMVVAWREGYLVMGYELWVPVIPAVILRSVSVVER